MNFTVNTNVWIEFEWAMVDIPSPVSKQAIGILAGTCTTSDKNLNSKCVIWIFILFNILYYSTLLLQVTFF